MNSFLHSLDVYSVMALGIGFGLIISGLLIPLIIRPNPIPKAITEYTSKLCKKEFIY